jgi:CspA family cold shock protein
MAKGTVKWFNPKKGFGFVVNETGADVFVHYTSIHGDGFRSLKSGQAVEYTELCSDKGLHGKDVRIICAVDSENKPAQREDQVRPG